MDLITLSFLHPLAGVVQVQAQLFVCHARGNSANIIIELQYFPSDLDNL